VIPAITTQWSDRQKELALKDTLISRFTQSAATAIEDAGFLVRDEAISKKVQNQQWRSRFTSTARQWNIDAETLESELTAYFPDTKLSGGSTESLDRAFRAYNGQVGNYIFLSSQVCKGDRAGATESLRKYLQRPYPSLGDRNRGNDCWLKTKQFKSDYVAAGSALLGLREPLLKTLVHAHAAGYSVGFRAFLKQLLPFY
jgi:hypothetical protein